MSTETYFPKPGDVVVFPGAKFEYNQTLRYVITGCAGDLVTFKTEVHETAYTYPIAKLRKIGITKAPGTAEESGHA